MDRVEQIVEEANGALQQASSAAELEQIKARYLGKSGALHRAAQRARQAACGRAAGGRQPHQRRQSAHRSGIDRAPPGARASRARLHGSRKNPSTSPCPAASRHRRHSSDHAHLAARRDDLSFHRLRCGRRARDRNRLVQLHCAEPAGESSCALDARYLLRRGRLLLRTHTSPMQVRYARTAHSRRSR